MTAPCGGRAARRARQGVSLRRPALRAPPRPAWSSIGRLLPLGGADAWLEKPLDAAVFSSLVARLFADARAGVHPE